MGEVEPKPDGVDRALAGAQIHPAASDFCSVSSLLCLPDPAHRAFFPLALPVEYFKMKILLLCKHKT